MGDREVIEQRLFRIQARQSMLDGDRQRDSWLCGSYDSTVRCIDDIWRFTHVALDLRLVAEAAPPWSLKKPFDQ